MKIQIEQALEEKLLKTAEQLRMSPTQYVNFLIDQIEIQIPKLEKTVVSIQPPRVDAKKVEHTVKSKFVTNW